MGGCIITEITVCRSVMTGCKLMANGIGSMAWDQGYLGNNPMVGATVALQLSELKRALLLVSFKK